ncbi:MAG: TIGR02099 family protein [Gammaproteobacteria bacterium]|nr:TIGR02099 family protein [Gammaproteobacteria bacterium]
MRRKLRALFWKLWYRVWAVIAVATILLALVFSVARVLFPIIPGYKAEIETVASQALHHPVSIDQISTDWKWFRPRLKLLNVVIRANNDDDPVLADVEQIILGINLFRSAVQGKLDVDDITLIGSALKVVRDKDGVITIQDKVIYKPVTDISQDLEVHSEPSPASSNTLKSKLNIPPSLQNREIKLANISIEYVDEILDLNYRAHSVDMAVDFETSSAALFLDIGLPPELGTRLEFAIETYGELGTPKNLNGRIFFRGTGLELANWKQPEWIARQVESGRMDLALWVDIKQPKNISLTGTINANNMSLKSPVKDNLAGDTWQAEELHLDFSASSDNENILATINNIFLKRDGRSWPTGEIGLSTPRDAASRFKKGILAVDFLRIEDVLPWIKAYIPKLDVAEAAGFKTVQGDIEKMYLSWDTTAEQQQLVAQANFKSLNIFGDNKVPTIKGINAKMRVLDNHIAIDLDIDALLFDYPRLFRQALPPIAITGQLQLQRTEQGVRLGARDLRTTNSDAQSSSWFNYDVIFSDKSLWATHYSQFEVFNANATPRYLPANGMHGAKGIHWLDNAFISGGAKNGEFTLRGPTQKIPFRNGEGIFRVEFDSAGNVLNFWEPGPFATDIQAHAVFDGPSMLIYGYEAKVLDSIAQDIVVRIDDFKDAPLLVSTNVYGSMDDAWSYIGQSEIRDIFEVVADQITVGGMHATRLELNIPMHNNNRPPEERLHSQYTIRGDLYNSDVNFRDWKLNFTGIEAAVRVTEKSIAVDTFQATLNNQPVTVFVDTNDIEDAHIITTHLQSNILTGDFLKSIELPVADFVTGRSTVQAELKMEMSRRGDADKQKPLLTINSDLYGTAMNFPDPLVKEENIKMPLLISAEFNRPKVNVSFRYGDLIRGVLRSRHDKETPQITHADISMSDGAPQLSEEPGINVHGRVTGLDIDQWRELSWTRNSELDIAGNVGLIMLSVDKFTYLNRTVDNLQLSLERGLHNWRFHLNSEVIQGQVLIPVEGFGKRGLSIDLQYADFDKINSGYSGKHPQPADVPPFGIRIERLKFNDWDLREVVILADQIDNTLKIHNLRINDPTVGLVGNGEWRVDESGKHHTNIKLNLNSKDVGEGLARFNFADLIEKGTGKVEFDLAWNAAPSDFDLAIMQGSATLDVKKGHVLDINPGGGRILGLLNLQMIPRRLALDFGDFFKEGYAFDDMKGTFSFSDGNAYSSDYHINGPVGRIDMNGRVGLVQKDYDQHVTFRPNLSRSLPVIGAILGGASGGWAMVVMDSMVRVFGGDTDKIAQARYTVTGSWEDPVITPIKKPGKENGTYRKYKSKDKVEEE